MLTSHLFENFYTLHHQWLYSFLRRKLGCQFQAADITQDTFVKVLTTDQSLALNQPRAFLTTTATRIMIDVIRKRQLEHAYLQHLQLSADYQIVESPEQLAIALSTLLQIADMLDTLSPKARDIFLMNRLDNLTHAEIAAHYGISVCRVRQYLSQVILKCCSITNI